MAPKIDIGMSDCVLYICRDDAPNHSCDACTCNKIECAQYQLEARDKWEDIQHG